MTTPQQTLERAYAALSAAAFAHPSAADEIGTQCSEAAKELRALLATQAQGQDAAPAEQVQGDAELLDWLEAMTDKGYCPAVVFDDDGHWAVLFDGIQSTPGDGPLTSSFIAGTETAWHDSIRAAIRAALAARRTA